MGEIVKFPHREATKEDLKGFSIIDRDHTKRFTFKDIIEEAKNAQDRYEANLCDVLAKEYDRIQSMPIDYQVYFNEIVKKLNDAQLKDME